MKVVTENGTPVWVTGTGKTIILIHGVLVDHRMWYRQVESLSQHYQVCCLDMLGHGEAADAPGPRSLADFVNQANEVVDLFAENGPPVLGGFSMGGLISQAYAVQHHAKLSGVILLNTVHDRSPEQSATVIARFEGNVAGGVEHAVQSGTTRWFKERDYQQDPEAIQMTIELMRDGDFAAKRKAHAVFVRAGAELTGKLGVISCPALVMTGEEDAGSTPEMARKMAAAIPDSELHILEGQHHMMPVLDADRVNGIIHKFMSKNVLS